MCIHPKSHSLHDREQRERIKLGDFAGFRAALLESIQLYADTEAGRSGMGSPVMAQLVLSGIESQIDMLIISGRAPKPAQVAS